MLYHHVGLLISKRLVAILLRIGFEKTDLLVSYAPCDWSYSCEAYHALLKIDTVYCGVASLKRETKKC